jgi:hypothetical protein
MLSQVLGHSSLVMIQRNYAHATPSDAHELMARLLADEWPYDPSDLVMTGLKTRLLVPTPTRPKAGPNGA